MLGDCVHTDGRADAGAWRHRAQGRTLELSLAPRRTLTPCVFGLLFVFPRTLRPGVLLRVYGGEPGGKEFERLYLEPNLAPRRPLTPCVLQGPAPHGTPCTLVRCSCLNFHSPHVSTRPVYTFANYSPYLTEPLILNHRGVSLRANTVLIEEFLTSHLVDTCLYDDLSKCSWLDSSEGLLL